MVTTHFTFCEGNFLKSIYLEEVDDKAFASDLIYFRFDRSVGNYDVSLDFKLPLDGSKANRDFSFIYSTINKNNTNLMGDIRFYCFMPLIVKFSSRIKLP